MPQQVTIEQLLQIVGDKEVQLALLRGEMARLQAELARLQGESEKALKKEE
jgi:uncharacterized small protein (DUF1192 family)